MASPDKDPARVAAGLKATLHNQNVSEEAKQYAQERLENMGAIGTQHHGKNKAEETFDPQHGSESHIIGGYKSTLRNEHTSEEAKAHAREVLEAAGYSIERAQGATDEEHETHVLAGYKAALHNPRVSDGAKDHAREYLRQYGEL